MPVEVALESLKEVITQEVDIDMVVGIAGIAMQIQMMETVIVAEVRIQERVTQGCIVAMATPKASPILASWRETCRRTLLLELLRTASFALQAADRRTNAQWACSEPFADASLSRRQIPQRRYQEHYR
jgi:hypothetical protein